MFCNLYVFPCVTLTTYYLASIEFPARLLNSTASKSTEVGLHICFVVITLSPHVILIKP